MKYPCIALIALLARPAPAQACRGPFPDSVRAAYGSATLVFYGRVLEVRDAPQGPSHGSAYPTYEAKVQVRKWWKGGNERDVMIRFDRSTCGAFLRVGQEGIFFAGGDPPSTSALAGNITHTDGDKVTP